MPGNSSSCRSCGAVLPCEALIDGECSSCRQRVPVDRAPRSELPPTEAAARSPALGTLKRAELPGYELVEAIDSGGQGVVWKAIRLADHRKVAVKFILAEHVGDAAARARFAREYQLLGVLDNPHIVRAVDCGELPAGELWQATEYVSGRPLDEFVKELDRQHVDSGQSFPVRQVLELFCLICDGVDAAHRVGIIHRDLKPSNILVDDDGRPRILDFGLARTETTEATVLVTMTGQFLGTYAFAAPEQVEGRPGQIDARTDVYSLGVILFNLLTNTFPYAPWQNRLELCDRIRSPDRTPPRSLVRYIDRDLEAVMLKSVARDRSARYQTVRELQADLDRYLRGERPLAKPPSGLDKLVRTARRHPAMAAGALALLVTAAVALIPISVLAHSNAAIAEDEAAARRRAELAEGDALGRLRDSYVQAAALARQRGDWEAARKNCDEAIELRHPDEVGLRLAKVEASYGQSDVDRAAAELAELAQRTDLGSALAAVRLWEADIGLSRWNYRDAEQLIRAAIDLGGLSSADTEYATGLIARNSPDAAECFARALAIDPYHYRANSALAIVQLVLGRVDEAQRHLSLAQLVYPNDRNLALVDALVAALRGDDEAMTTTLDRCEASLGTRRTELARHMLQALAELKAEGTDSEPNRLAMMTRAAALVMLLTNQSDADERDLSLPFPPFLAELALKMAPLITLTLAGKYEECVDLLGLALEVNPLGDLFAARGSFLVAIERYDEAADAFQQAAMTPSLIGLRQTTLVGLLTSKWMAAKRECVRRGVWPPDTPTRTEAVRLIREIRTLGPLSVFQASLLSNIAWQAGDTDLSRGILSDWRVRAADDIELLRMQARVEHSSGAYGSAILAADEVIRREPGDAEMSYIRWDSSRLIGRIGPPATAVSLEEYLARANRTSPPDAPEPASKPAGDDPAEP